MSLTNLLGMLQQYQGANAASPPANTQQDFEKVAQEVPQQHLAGGLSEAFQSSQTPPFADMVSSLFSQSNGEQRAGILSRLLGAAAPGLAGGLPPSLSNLLGGGTQVTPQQAEQVSPEAVRQLAANAQQNNPSIIQEASNFYAQHPKLVQGLGAGALALMMSHISRKV